MKPITGKCKKSSNVLTSPMSFLKKILQRYVARLLESHNSPPANLSSDGSEAFPTLTNSLSTNKQKFAKAAFNQAKYRARKNYNNTLKKDWPKKAIFKMQSPEPHTPKTSCSIGNTNPYPCFS